MRDAARKSNKIVLRDYQARAIDSVFRLWAEGETGRLLGVASVGAGKTIMLGSIIRRAYETGLAKRILVLTHVSELVEQNYLTLRKMWPEAPAGIYAAGLGRKDRAPILVGMIQSIINALEALPPVDLVLIDECHLISPNSETMYGKVYAALKARNPALKWVGVTGTAYRLNSGQLLEPWKDHPPLFDVLAFDISPVELLAQGHLCPVDARRSKLAVDTSGIRTRMGEFVEGDVDKAFNRDEVNGSIVSETINAARDENRKAWLIFAASIDHATRLTKAFQDAGVSAAMVTSETDRRLRTNIINRYRRGDLTCLVNVGVLTTGFDAPHTDLIVLARATASPGLLTQIVGRGVRNFDGKENCLVLDFGGNMKRHGVFGEIRGVFKRGKQEDAEAKQPRECYVCDRILPIGTRKCTCGYEFPKIERDPESKLVRHNTAQRAGVQVQDLQWFNVQTAAFSKHIGTKGISMLRLTYTVRPIGGPSPWSWTLNEYLCFDHRLESGHPEEIARKAQALWRERTSTGRPPQSVDEAIARISELVEPRSILAKKNGKYWDIVRVSAEPVQPAAFTPTSPEKLP